MSKSLSIPALLLALHSAAPAQNFMTIGDFQSGARWWRSSTTDPQGAVGFALADVAQRTPSEAAFADFRTLASDVSAKFLGWGFSTTGATVPVTFDVMWDKGTVTTPIGSPQDNWVELEILDGVRNVVFRGRLNAPGKAGTQERATFRGQMTGVPFQVLHAELVVHHSASAKVAYRVWMDDISIGEPLARAYSIGCSGVRRSAPRIDAYGQRDLGGTLQVFVTEAYQQARAVLAIGASNTRYGALTLPFDLGGGCFLAQDLQVLQPGFTSTLGSQVTRFAIPNDARLRGMDVYFQFACADPGSPNPGGFTTTAGLHVTVR